MQIIQSRRDFLAGLSAAGAAGTLAAAHRSLPRGRRKQPRSVWHSRPGICFAPMDVAEELLHAEGFKDIQYVKAAGGFSSPQMIAKGEVDFGASFAGTVVYHLDAGLPLTALAGLHAGCYELFRASRSAASAT